MRRLAVLSLLAVVLLTGCRAEEPAPPVSPRGPDRIRLVPMGLERKADPGERIVHVEISADLDSRAQGLMGRRELAADSGMLFVYPRSRVRSFWMKNCALELDAAFLDEQGVVLNIHTMEPGEGRPDESLPRYRSEGDAMYVLEMIGGWFKSAGTRPGDRILLRDALRGVEPR
ncbi:MAG: DUF192 domain-containing protein [Planctomycetota bacterium]|jgi:uncharacterized membrane protein (UPF0127 family)